MNETCRQLLNPVEARENGPIPKHLNDVALQVKNHTCLFVNNVNYSMIYVGGHKNKGVFQAGLRKYTCMYTRVIT